MVDAITLLRIQFNITNKLSWECHTRGYKLKVELDWQLRCLRCRRGGHCTKHLDVCNAGGGGHRTFQVSISGQIFKSGWGHRTKFKDVWEAGGGDTAHSKRTFVIQSANGGTPHNPHDTSVLRGWVGGWVVYQDNNATPWLHLASWNLPDSQPSWVSKMEPNVAKTKNKFYLPKNLFLTQRMFLTQKYV